MSATYPYKSRTLAEYLKRYEAQHAKYVHVHNYHMRSPHGRSICPTNVDACCLTDDPTLVTCLNCSRYLGPAVVRGADLTRYGVQVHR